MTSLTSLIPPNTGKIYEHFLSLEMLLTQSAAVIRYEIKRVEISPSTGLMRVKVWLAREELLEFREYIINMAGELEKPSYSYHWQDKDGRLRKRWDNAPHFPDLPHFPHHIHTTDEVVGTAVLPTLAAVLTEIEGQ